ncbi:uncharacterized protein TRUGW13939_00664 [Talaromyces rugulosus]|uniref:Mnd1 HTH domain-containing protein n=1 Tax=Talaromyces rugulosus TaxID=121627 RepID=A0A7H8QJD1_TALRU|nr:uncharacterized protein TRUGW13939_00664 [Talaromyces rugulosus]QKX53585.1 hypothetical protein TRUGW13939_00664 [Talaromyces rugulosus]
MSFGRSLALSQNAFLQPPTSSKDRISGEGTDDESKSLHRGRGATLQDSFAGRINNNRFIGRPYASRWRHHLSSSNAPLSSRNFLYSKDQPEDTEDEGFDSNDVDFVSSDARLPESDMLEAIHSYSSHFYANAVDNCGSNDFASMDETALIAMGILLEELANHSLGETGDLVLVERDGEDDSDLESVASCLSTGSRVRKRSNSVRSAPRNKSISPETKCQLILDYIRSTRICHTLKDLEKSLPPVASINGIQVKEYIQGLLDDNKIRVEKIGSVNWYWSFPSDEQRERENAKEKLVRDMERLTKTTDQLEAEIREKEASLNNDSGGDDPAIVAAKAAERKNLTNQKFTLDEEVKVLEAKQNALESGGAAGIKKKTGDIVTWKADTAMWTDNIYIMEQYLSTIACGDRDLIESVKRQCCGKEYVEGEGLPELQF